MNVIKMYNYEFINIFSFTIVAELFESELQKFFAEPL
jgi:hypothetical protein